MEKLPRAEETLAVRTDFSDAESWEHICEVLQAPDEEFGFTAHLRFVSDPQYEGLTVDGLVSILPEGADATIVLLIDEVAMSDREHPLLVVDVGSPLGGLFRVIPEQAWAVENNLSTGNMGYEEFLEAAGEDRVFRGLK